MILPAPNQSSEHLERITNPPKSGRFRFPLPADPIRVLADLCAHWPLLAVLALLSGIVGGIVGHLGHRPTFNITTSVLKRPVPQTVQTSPVGQAYRPADLNNATLLATLLSKEPVDAALRQVDNGLTAEEVMKRITASEVSGTQIFKLSYESPVSAQDAVDFTTVWLNEINSYTRQLQRADASGMRDFLQREVENLDAKIHEYDQRIATFSRGTKFLGADTQVISTLTQLSNVESELANARDLHRAHEKTLEELTAELRKMSPLDVRLKQANDELAALRSIYTDANPLVQAKQESIKYLEEQLAAFEKNGPAPLEEFTGTEMGRQLYLEIIKSRAELTRLAARLKTYQGLQEALSAKVEKYPDVVSRYRELEHQRKVSFTTRSMLSNRLEEARIFSANSPGYWKVFQQPDLREVTSQSSMMKAILMGTMFAALGIGLGLIIAFTISTIRNHRRSVLECCGVTQAPLLSVLSTGSSAVELDDLWVTNLALRQKAGQRVLVWTGLADQEDEARFWQGLAIAAHRDGLAPITVEDLHPQIPGVLPSIDGLFYATPRKNSRTYNSFLRLHGLPDESSRPLLSQVDYWIALTTNEARCLAPAERFLTLTRPYLDPPDGTIVLHAPPSGILRRMGETLSHQMSKYFNTSEEKKKPEEN